jgi:hypothetical protein
MSRCRLADGGYSTATYALVSDGKAIGKDRRLDNCLGWRAALKQLVNHRSSPVRAALN